MPGLTANVLAFDGPDLHFIAACLNDPQPANRRGGVHQTKVCWTPGYADSPMEFVVDENRPVDAFIDLLKQLIAHFVVNHRRYPGYASDCEK
jgi:hypothetical protein